MIEFQNLSFCYEENVMPSICDINLKILEGEFILLTGRSGCGKTTLCRMVNGLIPHFYSGEILGNVLLHGRSISSIDINARELGYEATKLLIDYLNGNLVGRKKYCIVDTELIDRG